MTVNKMILLGNMGRDPRVKELENGTKIASFSVATNHGRKSPTGEWENETTWHDVKAFGKTAEHVERFGDSGKKVFVEGRLEKRKYTGKDGTEKIAVEVIADKVEILKTGNEKSEPDLDKIDSLFGTAAKRDEEEMLF